MRAVVQRVLRAQVQVDGKVVSSIGRGLLVLAGLHRADTDEDLSYIANKILGLRVFDDEAGVMNLSLAEAGAELMVVSQFTLYGDARKGRRPSYSEAMPPGDAAGRFAAFVEMCASGFPGVKTGRFGADMHVEIVNDGPVTILLDSSRAF
ncbi:MAG: D-tyrosyl-tRNA(Tyr) deacylase [Spirochaetes bacterium]|nr:MAG: D-tyrosyl-tRNA(Tyr) deacylase [Spirochaetota bacterium]